IFTYEVRAHHTAPVGTIPGMAAYATGTNFHPGGEAVVGEFGPEIIRLPRGTQVDNHLKTRERLKDSGKGEITQNIHIHSPRPLSPSEIARKNLQVSRQLAMEWGI